MTLVDKLNRPVRAKAPKAPKPKPEMPGQMGFDGTIAGAVVVTKSVKRRGT